MYNLNSLAPLKIYRQFDSDINSTKIFFRGSRSQPVRRFYCVRPYPLLTYNNIVSETSEFFFFFFF